MLVDRDGLLARLYDFDVVPNGLFVDEAGILRLAHIGGFSVYRPEHVEQVEAMIAAASTADVPVTVGQERPDLEALKSEIAQFPSDSALRQDLAERLAQDGRYTEAAAEFERALALDPSSSMAAFGLGVALRNLGRESEALATWKQALVLDPACFVIRKQIWALEHPERFYPAIDAAWQKEELLREAEGRTDLAPPPRK